MAYIDSVCVLYLSAFIEEYGKMACGEWGFRSYEFKVWVVFGWNLIIYRRLFLERRGKSTATLGHPVSKHVYISIH